MSYLRCANTKIVFDKSRYIEYRFTCSVCMYAFNIVNLKTPLFIICMQRKCADTNTNIFASHGFSIHIHEEHKHEERSVSKTLG